MKAVVAAFNQEKALVGAFSVITNLRMELFQALPRYHMRASSCPDIYKNTAAAEESIRDSVCSELLHSVRDCLSLHYVTTPFVVFCFSNFLLYFWWVDMLR